MGNTIYLQDVSKVLRKKTVLTNVNIEVKEGEIFGLIGPSGCGKTSIIKIMVGMDKSNSGKAFVLGKKMPNLEILQQIGYMAQMDALYLELTGLENLKFYASLFKLNKSEQVTRITYASRLVNLTDELHKRVSTYSGGMKRRLSLAIALIQNPQILILDEPTVGIDPELRKTIWTELIRLKTEEQKTIIVTTHVMDEAEKCDRLAMIRDGKIITSGSPTELKTFYRVNQLEDVFIQAGGTNS